MKESISGGNVVSNASDTSRELDGGSGMFVSKEEKFTDRSLTHEGINDSQLEPRVGMIFNSEEEAYDFYNYYAKRKGFSIRKGHLSRRKDGSIRDRHYLCSNEGTRQEHRTAGTSYGRNIDPPETFFWSGRVRFLERISCVQLQEDRNNGNSVHARAEGSELQQHSSPSNAISAEDRQLNADEDQAVADFHYSQVVRKAITVVVKSAFSKEALELVERRLDKCMQETENTMPNAQPDNKQQQQQQQLEDVIIVHNLQQNAAEANNLLF